MKIDLVKLQKKGKSKESFSFRYQPETRAVSIPNVEIYGEVEVEGEVELITRNEAIVDYTVRYTLKGSCSRCGDDATKIVEEAVVEKFYEEGYAPSGEEDAYLYKNGVIDLAKSVDDIISLSMPMQIICKEDCLGLCSSCGCNLNKEKCNCEK